MPQVQASGAVSSRLSRAFATSAAMMIPPAQAKIGHGKLAPPNTCPGTGAGIAFAKLAVGTVATAKLAASVAAISFFVFISHHPFSKRDTCCSRGAASWVVLDLLDEAKMSRPPRLVARRIESKNRVVVFLRGSIAAGTQIRNIVNSNSTSWRDLVENLFQVLRVRALALPVSDKNSGYRRGQFAPVRQNKTAGVCSRRWEKIRRKLW